MRRTPSTFVWSTRSSSSAVDSVNGARPSARPGVVEEDVDAAELGDRRLDERRRARLVGDVELERDVGLDPLHPPRAAGDAHAGLAQLAHGRGADAGRGARDDRGLAGQVHAVRAYATRRRRGAVSAGAAEPRSASSMRSIVTGVVGRSRPSRSTSEMRSTTSWPAVTWPKTVCLPSSHGRRLGGDDEELRAVRVRARSSPSRARP